MHVLYLDYTYIIIYNTYIMHILYMYYTYNIHVSYIYYIYVVYPLLNVVGAAFSFGFQLSISATYQIDEYIYPSPHTPLN